MSDTSKTRVRRQLKTKAAGRDRKHALASKGTTPKFPIHPEATTTTQK